MRMLIFIFGYFSVFSGNILAQIDSNAEVRLYCGPFSDGCQIVLTVPPGVTDTFHESLNVDFDGSYGISEEDHSEPGTKFGALNPPFEIDTANKRIVNLQVYSAEPNADGENALVLSFQPVPYSITNGHIILHGNYPCSYSLWSVYQYRFIQGGCQDTGSSTDSLFLEIDPSSLGISIQSPIQRIKFTDNGIQLFELQSPTESRMLEIWNHVGMLVSRTPISSEKTEKEIAVPPGLYFARLGDQVAKFIVPQR